MEAQSGGSGGGEVRKIHIIYFLSRKGGVEHPHLLEVRHLSKNGVPLRDVKRWLSELRGKDMPESFAWSYKRRYKTGYIWQDLLDEDLITPISNNEYVLKGSEIPSINLSCPAVADGSVKIDEENLVKLEEEKTWVEKNEETERISANASTLTKKTKKKKKNDANNPSTPASATSSSSQFTKTSKSDYSNVFRLLIRCGSSLDTNESAIMINKKNSCYTPSEKPGVEKIAGGYTSTAKICKEDKLGGSERVLRAYILAPRTKPTSQCKEKL